MEDNSEKVNIMFNSLSKERRTHIENQIQGVINLLLDKKAQLGTEHSVELTERFDKEEPHQFIWLSMKILFIQQPYMVQTPQGMSQAIGYATRIVDAEVYGTGGIDHWIDHVQRIKKQDNIYLSKDGVVEQDKTESNNFNETVNNIEKEMNEENKEEFTEEDAINEQLWEFKEMFNLPNPVQRTTKEYIKTYQRYMSVFSNKLMEMRLDSDEDNFFGIVSDIQNSLSMLMSEFDKCNFTSFRKAELESLGFINWRNKIMLIPVWAYPCILKNNHGLVVKSTYGDELIVGRNFMDTDSANNGSMPVGFPFTVIKGAVNETKFVFEYRKESKV